MNFAKVQRKNRKAISPVLATVILIAITLIAAIAIAGFVFGLFGSFTHTATITATVTSCYATGLNCSITLSNTGTASANVIAGSISYGGVTYTLSGITGTVTAGSTLPVSFTTGGAAASVGEAFTGSISLSNGGSVPFTGTFQ
jgi:archaeal type IV pilus assembly protein PilA